MANYFLKIDGVDGESHDEKHENEIDVESYSFGAARATARTSGGGGAASDVNVFDITITKIMDKSSPTLLKMIYNGKSASEAKLVLRKMGGEDTQVDYGVYTLKDVMISSVQQSGGGDIPMESVSLNFAEVTFEYTQQQADNTAGATSSAGWSVQKNKAL